MKHTQKKILDALNIIKEVCEEEADCIDCPFGSRNAKCMIEEKAPMGWEINENCQRWRAFR